MEKNNSFNQIAFLFILGIAGCALSFIASALTGSYSSISIPSDLTLSTATTTLAGILGGTQEIPSSSFALSALFHLIGLPLSAFGFYAVLKLFSKNRKVLSGFCKWSLVSFLAFATASYLICTITLYIWKIFVSQIEGNRLSTISDFAFTFLMPSACLMLISYFVLSVILFIAVISKSTSLPLFFVVFNPLVPILLIVLLNLLIPGVPIWNVIKWGALSASTLIFTASAFIHFLVSQGGSKSEAKSEPAEEIEE